MMKTYEDGYMTALNEMQDIIDTSANKTEAANKIEGYIAGVRMILMVKSISEME